MHASDVDFCNLRILCVCESLIINAIHDMYTIVLLLSGTLETTMLPEQN